MSTGTLTEIRKLTAQTSTSVLEMPDSPEIPFFDTPVRHRMRLDDFGEPFLFNIYGPHFVVQTRARNISTRRPVLLDWDEIVTEPTQEGKTIWDTANLQALLSAPLGSPVELTREEADEVVRLAFGRRPDLRPGKEFVEEIRELLGHSIIERMKSIDKE